MADEPLKFEYRVPRALGYLLAGGSLYFAALAIGLALSEPYGFYRWEWFSNPRASSSSHAAPSGSPAGPVISCWRTGENRATRN